MKPRAMREGGGVGSARDFAGGATMRLARPGPRGICSMPIAVVRFPGSNCDQDAVWALEDVLSMPVQVVRHDSMELPSVDGVVLPGGFSYGDYLRSGALAARSPIMNAVAAFAQRGGPVLGICNGFQVLTEAGLLPGALARNDHLHFVCKDVHLRVEQSAAPFTSRLFMGDLLKIPVAHHEGRYVASDEELDRLEGENQVVLRYVDASGRPSEEANPNGSVRNIAGIVNERGNVLGMMPHPERAVDALLGSEDGLGILGSFVDAIAATGAGVNS